MSLLPDVILLDLRMPEKDGLQVITELMSPGEPKPRIIVMTTYESEGDVRRALKAGAKGYLVKGADPEQIREAVRKVAAGQSLLSLKSLPSWRNPWHVLNFRSASFRFCSIWRSVEAIKR